MTDAFAALSQSIATRVRAAAPLIVGLDWGTRAQTSAVLWSDGVIVSSEQSLPEMDTYNAVLPGGERVQALPIGRDPGTNVAALRVHTPAPARLPAETPEVGALVLALGSDGQGGPRVRLGAVETLGPAWQSQCGGRIDQLIRLDVSLGLAAEGGPVVDAAGGVLGMSTFGPRKQVLVIPSATIDRVVGVLVQHGHVARGWLGVGVQPVAIPDDMAKAVGSSCGLMVLSLAAGAPAAGRGLPGDILVSAGGTLVQSPKALTTLLTADLIGTTLELRLLRGGVDHQCQVEVAVRPS